MTGAQNHPDRVESTPETGRAPCLQSICLVAFLAWLLPMPANALEFQIDFRTSTYQVQSSDTYASLLAQHQSEALITTNTLDALQGISAPVYAGGVNQNYSILMTSNLTALVSGTYTFQVGTDWGRGGASSIVDQSTSSVLDEFVTTDDIWWANDWNNTDVFTSTVNMIAGTSYMLGWIGFEGCCGGSATVRYAVDGGSFQVLDSPNGDIHFITNPEPNGGVLLGLGLLGLAARRYRVDSSHSAATSSRASRPGAGFPGQSPRRFTRTRMVGVDL